MSCPVTGQYYTTGTVIHISKIMICGQVGQVNNSMSRSSSEYDESGRDWNV